MQNISIIQRSQLEGALRLDAEYYQPELLEIENKFKKLGYRELGNLVDIQNNLRIPLEKSLRKNGIYPYYGASGISDFVDDYIFEGNYLLVAEDGENLRSRKQPIAYSVSGKFWVNNHAHILKFKNNLDQFLIETFLNVTPLRSISGVAQPKLTKENLVQIKTPIFPDNLKTELNKIFVEKEAKDIQSNFLYIQAEELLLDELGLKDYKIENNLSFVVTLSDIKSAGRADAEHFQPKYEELIEKIKKQNAKKFEDLVTIKKGFEPGSEAYQEEGKLFIRVSSLSKNGLGDKDQKYLSEELYQKLREDFEPKVGEILLTKDASPGTAYVLKEPVEGIISGGILRLKIKDSVEPEYLALCINSIVGQWQAERDAGGSIIVHWKPEQIRNLLTPILPKQTQQKIADLVRQSHEARKKSKELLEEAKRKVEEMIKKRN